MTAKSKGSRICCRQSKRDLMFLPHGHNYRRRIGQFHRTPPSREEILPLRASRGNLHGSGTL
jgi:hypothetical protein